MASDNGDSAASRATPPADLGAPAPVAAPDEPPLPVPAPSPDGESAIETPGPAAASNGHLGTPEPRGRTARVRGNFLDKRSPGGVDDADTWLMVTVAMIPIVAIIVVIAVYASLDGRDAPLWSILSGLGAGVVTFVALLLLYRLTGSNTPQHASVVSYNDMCRRMDRAVSLEPVVPAGDPSLQVAAAAAAAEVDRGAAAFDYVRDKNGVHWVLGKGYVDLGRIVHRAEEALMMYEPVDMVVADGLTDLARLDGSTIPRADVLLDRASHAIIELSPTAAEYLPQVKPPQARADAPAPPTTLSAHTQARMVLRHVRYTIDEFRDSRRARLIDARNELVVRMFLTALATSCLLVFVVLAQPPAKTLVTGAVLYAVGATVGLFSRLYADLQTDSFADDYAISYVRLFQSFLLSGHAAVAGVFIAVALPLAFNAPLAQQALPVAASPTVVAGTPVAGQTAEPPAATATAPASGDSARAPLAMPPLTAIYNVDTNPFSIVVAMIFGLTPGLLISRLSQGIERDKQDLRSSEPTTKARPSD